MKRILLIFTGIFIIIFSLLLVLGDGGLSTDGIDGSAKYNLLAETIFTAEIYALIVLGILAVIARKYIKKHVFFSVSAGIASLAALLFTHSLPNYTYSQLSSILHYRTFDSADYTLESIWPRFIIAQLLLIAVLGGCYLIEKKRHKSIPRAHKAI